MSAIAVAGPLAALLERPGTQFVLGVNGHFFETWARSPLGAAS
jgi:hypothetical protein